MMISSRNINLAIIALILSTFLPFSVIPTSAKASFMDSHMVSNEKSPVTPRKIDEIKVKRALEHKLVSQRLKDSGLSREEVMQKMERMSDEEIHQLASMSDKLPAGGSGAGVLVSALALVAAVLLVIYIIERKT